MKGAEVVDGGLLIDWRRYEDVFVGKMDETKGID